MNGGARGRTLAKLALTAAALWLALRKVDLRSLGARLASMGAGAVLGLSALTFVVVVLSVVRWWRLLHRLGERVPFWALFGDVTVGLLYNLFLPTSVGGDVVRALRCRGRVVDPAHAWSSSLFERLAGLVAMAVTGATAAAVGAFVGGRLPVELVATAAFVAFVLVALFFFAHWPFRTALALLERRLPTAAAADARGIVRDLAGPLATRGARLEALGWSVLYQAASLLFVLAGAAALGAPGFAAALLVGVPLVTVLSLAPITLGGHGLREGLYVGVLGALGVPSDVALGLDAQWLASSVAFALVGAVVASATVAKAGAPAPRAPAREHR